MRYMFLLYAEESDEPPTPEAMAPWMEFGAYADTVAKSDGGEPLQPGATATTVSVRDGKTITTDGPFVDTKEQLGGYYIFDCENLDISLDLAARIPLAPYGHVEVRPIMEIPTG